VEEAAKKGTPVQEDVEPINKSEVVDEADSNEVEQEPDVAEVVKQLKGVIEDKINEVEEFVVKMKADLVERLQTHFKVNPSYLPIMMGGNYDKPEYKESTAAIATSVTQQTEDTKLSDAKDPIQDTFMTNLDSQDSRHSPSSPSGS
jgi:hypothetical protein